ncbi:dolichol kinase, partial [Coemansia sp. RSA 1933]
MALVPLLVRVEWRNNGGGVWEVVARDSNSCGVAGEAKYRRSADDGLVWGVVLVPLVVMASELAHISDGSDTDGALSVLSRADLRSASIAMGLRLALSAVARDTRSMRLPAVLVGWIVSVFVLGYAALDRSSHGLACIGAWIWRSCVYMGAAEAQQMLLASATTGIPHSFTLGEASVITQGVVLVAVDLAGKLVQRAIAVDGVENMETLFLEATVLGLVLLVRMLASMRGEGSREHATQACVAAVCLCGMLSLAVVAYVSDANPAGWALKTALGSWTSISVCIYWAALLCCTLLVYTVATNSSQTAAIPQSSKLVLHLKRKAYHVLAVLMFVPGYLLSPQLQHFAFAVALVVFVAAECVRALDVMPWSQAIDGFVRKFTDYRDDGAIVTSHFYLLLGCAVPVWLGGPSAVACLAGVLALGLADTAASLVGMSVGRVRWPGTAKTVEGTVGFIVCLAAAALAVDVMAQQPDQPAAADVMAQQPEQPAAAAAHIVLCAVLGVVEALTEQNDNMVIPL